MGVTEGPLRRWYGSLMFTNEGDEHGRLRRLVNAAFKPKAVSALRAATRAIVEERFGDLRRDGGGDLMREFQYVPMRVMCDLLGVPHEDVSIFGAWADALSPVFLFMSPEQIDAATDAIGELLGYLDKLVDRRRRRPDEDLISALIAAEDEGNRLTHEELLDMVANLLVGGHDTTASQIGCTLFELLVRPETVAELAARPQTIASAVDSRRSFSSPAQSSSRSKSQGLFVYPARCWASPLVRPIETPWCGSGQTISSSTASSSPTRRACSRSERVPTTASAPIWRT
jgi:cytochrome P450